MADPTTFHEDFGRDDAVDGPTDRAFGLTVGGILLGIAGVRVVLRAWGGAGPGWLEALLAAAGGTLVVIGLGAPARLALLNRAWMKLGLALSRVVNPLVLGLIYVTTIVPIGLIMRLLGRDLLSLRLDREATSYWEVREPPGPAPDSLKDQF